MELMFKILMSALIFVALKKPEPAEGHGMIIKPPHRGSRWRFDKSAPPNYDDNGLFCGGKETQHRIHGGKCGICGDNYGSKLPRRHEIGGVYGQGVITGKFTQGSTIKVIARITANHKGYFVFDICNLDHQKETEQCFNQKVLTPEGNNYVVPTDESRDFEVSLKLPEKLSCEHCVLRWTYHTANSWGNCVNGTGAVGCGPQETFRTCSDIKIMKSNEEDFDEIPEVELDIPDKNFGSTEHHHRHHHHQDADQQNNNQKPTRKKRQRQKGQTVSSEITQSCK